MFLTDAHTPGDDALRQRMLGDLFIFGVAEALLDGCLGRFERKDAQRVRKLGMKFVLFLKAGLDILTNVEVFIVVEIHLQISCSQTELTIIITRPSAPPP